MRCLVSLVVAVLMCSTAAAAQKPTERREVVKTVEPANVTVIGCLARGSEGGAPLLTHALKSDAIAKPKVAGAKGAKGATAKPMTYALVGNTALDAHLGHKVEVSGTIAKPPAPIDAKPGMARKTYDTVTVKTIKMLSASCP
jgi:hypothetical protein